MSVDYIVSSLPALRFGESAPVAWEKFAEAAGGESAVAALIAATGWADLEKQLRNAVAEARGDAGGRFRRPADGCSLYWRNRALACFQERDLLRRDELLDRVFWDAAGELTDVANPLGRGALATYAIRLRIALKRGRISTEAGQSAFGELTKEQNSL